MPLINPGDSMTHVMNNVLNPVIEKANMYTSDFADTGTNHIVDSRRIAFTDNVGDSISLPIEGLDPDEKVVRAVVRYFNSSDNYDYFYPCTEVSYDHSTKVMTAKFHTDITEGDLFVEFWKRYDKATPTIETITGKTEMRKVRSEILNPAIERIKDLTQDVVKTGSKCVSDHRSWKNISLGSLSTNATLHSVDADEYPVRVMFRSNNNSLGRALYIPAHYIRFLRGTKRMNVFAEEVIGGNGNMYIEFWKDNPVVPLESVPSISAGSSLSGIRQNSVNHSLVQMNAHAQEVVVLSALVKNIIDYRSHDYDADGDGLQVDTSGDIYPVRFAMMKEDGACVPCKTLYHDHASNSVYPVSDEHRKGEMFVEYWKDV